MNVATTTRDQATTLPGASLLSATEAGYVKTPARGLRWVGALLAASVILAACSAIPPQSVTDPLGLDGQSVAVRFAGFAGVQAVPGDGGGTFTVADLDVSLPLNPGTMLNTVAIASARLLGETGPETISITNAELTVRIWQGAESFDLASESDRAEVGLATDATMVLERGSCFAGSCNYIYQSGPTKLGDLKLSGATLSTALSVMTTAPSPNSGSVSLTVQADPDELAGRTLTIELEASEGEIRF